MNIDKIREETPHCADKIFLNTAGASLMPIPVIEKINQYLDHETRLGGYKVQDLWESEISEFYTQVARLLGAHERNIAFAHDATDAYAKALSSIDFQSGDVILTTNDDYASNQIQFLSLQQRLGVHVIRANNLDNGDLDLDNIEALISEHQPKLIAVTHIPTNSGLIQDVETIGQLCSKHDILYLVDACQSTGQMVVDVSTIKCDFLSATGRKFLRGPRGTGFLYVSDRVLEQGNAPLYLDAFGATWTSADQYELQSTAKRYETWESPYALVIGLSEAVRYANSIGMDDIEAYNKKIAARLRHNLEAIPKVTQYDRGSVQGNIITFRKDGKSLDAIKLELDEHNVFYSTSTLEWGLIDFKKKGVDGVIRLSPHYFNTEAEMDRVAEIIEAI